MSKTLKEDLLSKKIGELDILQLVSMQEKEEFTIRSCCEYPGPSQGTDPD